MVSIGVTRAHGTAALLLITEYTVHVQSASATISHPHQQSATPHPYGMHHQSASPPKPAEPWAYKHTHQF